MDISIKNLKTYIFDPKTESLRVSRAKDIVSQKMVVTEKVDGTKLTLVRTTEENNPDYTKNWIVAYKGSVLHAKEFAHLQGKEDIESSVGIGQYALVFNHLKSINHKISQIPKSTEFSVEFAQNKDTLTRTYEKFGGMFLRSYAEVNYRILGGLLHTSIKGEEITDYSAVQKMAYVLEISPFPIFYQGTLTREDLLKNPTLAPKLQNVNWEDPLDVVFKFSGAMLSVPSSLGGKTEGVVLKLANGQFFKLVQDDQYSAEVRGEKKNLYRLDPETTEVYFQQIRSLIQRVLAQTGTEGKSEEDIISDTNFYITKNATTLKKFFDELQKITGGKKNLTQIKDDIHETVRLLVSKEKLLGKNTKNLGLIPIAGKPLHIGHWKLIEKASQENDSVVIYTSTSDRVKKGEFPIKGDDFVNFWTDIFLPTLPKNVRAKFVDSPVRAIMHELQWLEQSLVQDKQNVPNVNLYSDKEDVETNFKDEDLKRYPKLLASGKIKKVGVDRSTTVDISGTKMREFLQNGDWESFFRYLPPVRNIDKETIWNTLNKHKSEIKESYPYLEWAADIITEVERDLVSEGGWRGKETQDTTITPQKVSKIIKMLEQTKTTKKLDKAETPMAMQTVEKIKKHADVGEEIAKQIIKESYLELLAESGQSVAAVDSKTPKTVDGQPAQATGRLKIVDANGKDIHSAVSNDVKELVHALNEKVGFWKKNNPHIENGFVFNGSSQYLMDPSKFGVLSKYKSSFGDIDVIVPKNKLNVLEKFLDSIDDNQIVWKSTPKNKLSAHLYYVGRTKSVNALLDQTVTLWYYVPTKQIVQLDFEGDDMVLDPNGYEKPSEWIKFAKDSPWEDLTKGIKGVAGALLLRALARATTRVPNVVVLTPGGVKRVMAGAEQLTPKDITIAERDATPSTYTLNTGSGGAGLRKTYEFVKSLPYNGKVVDAWRFIDVKEIKPEDRITNPAKIFEILFKRAPSQEEVNSFRSFQGLLRMTAKELDKPTIALAMKKFSENIAREYMDPKELASIKKAVKDTLGMTI